MSEIPIVDTGTAVVTMLVDHVVAVQRLYGLTQVVFAETRPLSDPRDGHRVREVTLRVAIPTERVADICAALMAGSEVMSIDESKATVQAWGKA